MSDFLFPIPFNHQTPQPMLCHQIVCAYISVGVCSENILSGGSADKRFATCAAEASNPSKSTGPSSEISLTSNPGDIQVSTLAS